MVYGLNPERMNCDRLFNLFCLYGNVIKVSIICSTDLLFFSRSPAWPFFIATNLLHGGNLNYKTDIYTG